MHFKVKTPYGDYMSMIFETKDEFNREFLNSTLVKDKPHCFMACANGVDESDGTCMVVLQSEVLKNSVFTFFD